MTNVVLGIFTSFEPAQWVVVITAVLSAFVSIVVSIMTFCHQRKWNQKKIDADLKAKARIDWIQKVREHTAELLSIYYGILNETDTKKVFEKIQEARKHSDILILFFSDTKKDNSVTNINNLKNTESNDGKNNEMVSFVSSLFERVNQYYKDLKDNKLGQLTDNYYRAMDFMQDFPLEEKILGTYIDEEGEEVPSVEVVYDPKLKAETDEAAKQLEKYKESINEILNTMNELRDYMRIYLKIEWNIAKEGN